ncbi:MAG: RAMP superfamily CRISPR-associated protein [Thermoanaerobaculia bacterium]
MFQTLQNTMRISFTLEPDGPILVRAQTVGLDPGVADMEFQRTHRNGKSTVFLAGSGLKGVIRSHAERLLRTRGLYACDPTLTKAFGERKDVACGSLRKDDRQRSNTRKYPHDGQCSSCFTFGSLHLAGRFRVSDAYPREGLDDETNLTEVRTGVGIDRRSQSAQHNVLYDTEVVVRGGFDVRIQGENFSLWQAALVLSTLEDLDAGLVRIGGCKARGMGSVLVKNWKVELGFLDRTSGKLTGARRIASSEADYALPESDQIDAPEGGEPGEWGLFRTVCYEGDKVRGLVKDLGAGPLEAHLRRFGSH